MFANADSPLLRLPPEISNIIFACAVYRPNKMRLYYNSHIEIFRSGFSSHVYKRWHEPIAFSLPQVCRQIYAETVTLIYTINRFSFATHYAMSKWLSKRLPARLEAIKHLELLDEEDDEERADVLQQLKDISCRNLCSLTRNTKTAGVIAPLQAWVQSS
ncbi:uncharacterized protein M421DRAFT_290872 [Didymella exigua CBS 183.55]|uniref:DUF7730 domain-containing protein n=1 Tax=Didymella exigua CBS 183.55 TaxID=1150837 RepID=A0A6A5S1L8_9PLEO|nr:uncharacterized protein M421DRAFT_290872 [Didymella exigua CBS 183.55]KAF1932386.1 hypothetical protein M421DRAFT_290872 [Didymella exigua CBS 183.55]